MSTNRLMVQLEQMAAAGHALKTLNLTKDEVLEIVNRFDPAKGHTAIATVLVPPTGQKGDTGRKILVARERASGPREAALRPMKQDPEDGTIVALMIAPTDLEVD